MVLWREQIKPECFNSSRDEKSFKFEFIRTWIQTDIIVASQYVFVYGQNYRNDNHIAMEPNILPCNWVWAYRVLFIQNTVFRAKFHLSVCLYRLRNISSLMYNLGGRRFVRIYPIFERMYISSHSYTSQTVWKFHILTLAKM